jgi:hypothetical protein
MGGGGGGGHCGVPSNYPYSTRTFIVNGRLFQLVPAGLIMSVDGGATWSLILLYPKTCVGIGYITATSTYYVGMQNGEILSSTDLINFTTVGFVSTLPQLRIDALSSDGTTLTVCGLISVANFRGQIFYSTNGTTWTQGFAGGNTFDYQWITTKYVNGNFFAFTPSYLATHNFFGYVVSSNGTSWGQVGTGTLLPNAMAYGSTNVVLANRNSASTFGLAYGPIGGGFTQVLTGTQFNDVGYGGGVFVAVAGGGVIYSSSDDGVTWTARTSGTTDSLSNVIWTGTKFIVTTLSGGLRIYQSTNGTTWSVLTTLSAATFNAGAGGTGGLASGGGGGGAALTGNNTGAGGAGGAGYAIINAW